MEWNGMEGNEREGNEREGKERNGTERNGTERNGKERKGNGRKGKERKGKERKGKERKGKERKGKERKGKERKGKERQLIYYIVLTSHGLYVSVEDGDLAVELALEAQREDGKQGAEAQEGTAAAVEDTGRLPRVGRQVRHAEVTAINTAHLRRNLSTQNWSKENPQSCG